MSIYYCQECDKHKDNDIDLMADSGICEDCDWYKNLCPENSLPDEKDVDLTPKGDDEDFISHDQIKSFARGLGLSACIALSSHTQAQHKPDINVYLGSGRHEVPEEMLELAMTKPSFKWLSESGEEHIVIPNRYSSKWETAEHCGRWETKVRFSSYGVRVRPSEPIIGCYRSTGNVHVIHAWVNKGEYKQIMIHELGHFLGVMEEQDAHFHQGSDRDIVH